MTATGMTLRSDLNVVLKRFSPARLEAISVEWERETGYDSIPTIETHYHTGTLWDDRYRCVFPDCGFVRRNPVDMWFHVHLGQRHDPDVDALTTLRHIALTTAGPP